MSDDTLALVIIVGVFAVLIFTYQLGRVQGARAERNNWKRTLAVQTSITQELMLQRGIEVTIDPSIADPNGDAPPASEGG